MSIGNQDCISFYISVKQYVLTFCVNVQPFDVLFYLFVYFLQIPDPILQHHGENSHIIGSSLDSPGSEDSKDVDDLESCH